MRNILAITSGGMYGMYLFLVSLSAKTGIPSSIGAMTLQVTAAVGGIVIVLLSSNKPTIQQIPVNGILLAILAGAAVQFGELFSFMAYERGLNVTVGSLVIVGLQVLIPVILGVVFSKDLVSPAQLLAIGLILLGVFILNITR